MPSLPSSAADRCPVDHQALPGQPAPASGCPVSAGAAAFNPFERDYMQNPADYLRWARAQEPVFWSPRLGYWIVTRFEDVKAVFRDHLLFSPSVALEKITPATPEVNQILQRYGFAMGRTMVNEDEPDHMERRRLLMDAFLPENLLKYEPMVRTLARQYMDRFVHKGRADLVGEMFYEIPLNIALKFLGVPDDGAEQLRQFAVAHTLNTWGRPSHEEQLAVAENVGRFWQTAQGILDSMLANPDGEGWMFETIRQHFLHPDIVPMSYLRSMMMAILAAAHETTSNATANAFMTLLGNRQAWQSICANPALIPNAVEECLRVAGPIIAWRRIATADAQIGGVAIAKGEKLLIVQASANFDALQFEDPDAVDLYRENAVEHLSFGYGAHQCMGKNIGRMQMRIFLEEFVQRMPHIRMVPGQTFEYLSNTSFRGPAQLWVEWDPAHNPKAEDQAKAPKAGAFYIGPPSKDTISRPVVVMEKIPEGNQLFRFELADPQGEPLPVWTPGAHIDLIAGGFRRKYSLCGQSQDRSRYEVVVQREGHGRGGSRHFCDEVAAGARIQMSGPKNLFRLDETARRYVLVAGGIGITPLIVMADRLQRLGKSYELHYAGQSRQQMAWLERATADHAGQLHLYVKEDGRRMALGEMFTALDSDTRVYACGPDRMLAELEALSAAWPAGVLHFEHFSGAATTLDPDKEHAFVAELQDSGLQVTVGRDQTLLQALHAAGLDVPCDCGEGLCGTCEVGVLRGVVDHRDKVLSRAERASNQRMMACCSRASGNKIVLSL